MPVDSKHIFYTEKVLDWDLVSDVLEGERVIKKAGVKYAPKLSGQTVDEYDAYIERGSFFNASARTVQGLSGAVMRKEVKIEAPTAVEDMLEHITVDGVGIKDVTRILVDNLISFGYYGILADVYSGDGPTTPFFSLYGARDIYNWQYEYSNETGLKLTMLVLKEEEYEPEADDKYEMVAKEQLRVITLEEGSCISKVYRKGEDAEWYQVKDKDGNSEKVMKLRGMKFDFIPFQFYGAVANVPAPCHPPLINLMYTNLQHWKLDVDYHHGLHFCAIPTPWAAGFPVEQQLHIGGTKAWVSEDSKANCGFLEFTGQGLAAIKDAMADIQKMMAVLGARLLEEQKKAAEAAETLRIRSSGDTATLSTIVGNIESGLTTQIEWVRDWMGKSGEVTVSMNKDFVSSRLAPQDVEVLLKTVQSGEISQETFLRNLKEGEILGDDTSVEEEIEKIELETNNEEFANPSQFMRPGTGATPATLF